MRKLISAALVSVARSSANFAIYAGSDWSCGLQGE